LAGIGKHCPHINFGQTGCLGEGRIDTSCCVDSVTRPRQPCSFVAGVTSGVLCCLKENSGVGNDLKIVILFIEFANL